ncbi:hypothetical protein ANN_17596 [Periplaneta americana]|uniref:Uncharacterized protein n=1 Tax=Periplaneta americana TaxID=6978 RepID=A0ABQ8SUT7_PERAM|nr:hypothetical protein ANN_17596 [Periplaneta americana]
MASLCEGGNEPPGSLKAIKVHNQCEPCLATFIFHRVRGYPQYRRGGFSGEAREAALHLFTKRNFTNLQTPFSRRTEGDERETTGVAQSVEALAYRCEVALGRGFYPRLG